MISLSDFFMRPSGGHLLVVVEDLEQTPEGRVLRDRHDLDPMATDREINCPSAGKSVSAYRETGMSASTVLEALDGACERLAVDRSDVGRQRHDGRGREGDATEGDRQ